MRLCWPFLLNACFAGHDMCFDQVPGLQPPTIMIQVINASRHASLLKYLLFLAPDLYLLLFVMFVFFATINGALLPFEDMLQAMIFCVRRDCTVPSSTVSYLDALKLFRYIL